MALGRGSSHHGALFPTKFAQLKTARTGVRSTLQTLGADTDERELRALAGHDEDATAILKLCVFVEVRERVIKPELRRSHRETRCSQHMREAANLLRGEGEKLGAQLSLWR